MARKGIALGATLLALMPSIASASLGDSLCPNVLSDADLMNMKLNSNCVQEYCDASVPEIKACESTNSCCDPATNNLENYNKCRACKLQAQNNILSIDFENSTHFNSMDQLNDFTDLTFNHDKFGGGGGVSINAAATSILFTSFASIDAGGQTVTVRTSYTRTYYSTVTAPASTVIAPIPKVTRTRTENAFSMSTVTINPAVYTQAATTVTLDASTVTLDPSTVTLDPSTVTLPGTTVSGKDITETLPASTVTLDASTVTQPAQTVTQPAQTVTQPAQTITQPASTVTITGSQVVISSLVPTTISNPDTTFTTFVETSITQQAGTFTSLIPTTIIRDGSLVTTVMESTLTFNPTITVVSTEVVSLPGETSVLFSTIFPGTTTVLVTENATPVTVVSTVSGVVTTTTSIASGTVYTTVVTQPGLTTEIVSTVSLPGQTTTVTLPGATTTIEQTITPGTQTIVTTATNTEITTLTFTDSVVSSTITIDPTTITLTNTVNPTNVNNQFSRTTASPGDLTGYTSVYTSTVVTSLDPTNTDYAMQTFTTTITPEVPESVTTIVLPPGEQTLTDTIITAIPTVITTSGLSLSDIDETSTFTTTVEGTFEDVTVTITQPNETGTHPYTQVITTQYMSTYYSTYVTSPEDSVTIVSTIPSQPAVTSVYTSSDPNATPGLTTMTILSTDIYDPATDTNAANTAGSGNMPSTSETTITQPGYTTVVTATEPNETTEVTLSQPTLSTFVTTAASSTTLTLTLTQSDGGIQTSFIGGTTGLTTYTTEIPGTVTSTVTEGGATSLFTVTLSPSLVTSIVNMPGKTQTHVITNTGAVVTSIVEQPLTRIITTTLPGSIQTYTTILPASTVTTVVTDGDNVYTTTTEVPGNIETVTTSLPGSTEVITSTLPFSSGTATFTELTTVYNTEVVTTVIKPDTTYTLTTTIPPSTSVATSTITGAVISMTTTLGSGETSVYLSTISGTDSTVLYTTTISGSTQIMTIPAGAMTTVMTLTQQPSVIPITVQDVTTLTREVTYTQENTVSVPYTTQVVLTSTSVSTQTQLVTSTSVLTDTVISTLPQGTSVTTFTQLSTITDVSTATSLVTSLDLSTTTTTTTAVSTETFTTVSTTTTCVTHNSGLFTTTVPSGSPNVWTSDDGSLHTNTGPITETGSWYTTTDANGSPSETYSILPTSTSHHSGLFTTTVPSGSPNVWTSDDGSLHTNTGPITETGSWYTTTDANGSPSETYSILPTSTPHHSGLFTTTVPSGSPNVWTSDDGSLHTNTGPITETGSWYTTTDANGSPSETYTIYPTSNNGSPSNTGAPGNSGMPGMNTNNQPHHSGLFTTTVPSGSPNVWTSDDGSLHTNTGPITETGSWYTTTDANGSPSETYTIFPTSTPHHSGLFTTTVPSGSPNVWTSDDGSLHTNTGPITETGSWYTTTDANGSPSETYTIFPTSTSHHSGLFTTTVPSGSPNVWTSDDGSLHTNTGPITETGSWYTTTDANGSPSETYTIFPTSTPHHSGLFTTTVPSGSPNVWTSDDGSLHTNTGPITETGSWYTTTDANGSPSETYTIYPTSNNGSPSNTGAPGNSGMPGMNTNNQPHHSGLFTTTVPSGSPNVWTSDDGSLHTNTGPITETGSWYTTTDANGSPSETYTIFPTSTHHSGLFTTTVPSGSPNVWTSDDGSLHTNTGPITETGSWYTTTDANGSPSETYTIYPTSTHHSGLFTTTVPSGSPNVWTSDDGSLHTNTGPITETGSWYTTTDANGSPSETYTIYPTSNNGSPSNTGAPGNSGMPGMNTNNQPHHSGLFTTTVPSGSPNVWTSDDGSLHTNTGPITETGSWYTTTDANGSPSETYTIYPTSNNGSPSNTGAPGNSEMPGMNTNNQPHHSGLFTTTVPSGSPNVWTSDDGSLHTNTGPITETGSWYTTTDANGSPSETYTIFPTSTPHHSGLFTTTVPSGSPNVWTSDDGSLHTNTGPITETGSWYTTTDANGSPSETYTIYPTSNNGSPSNTGAPGNSGMPGMNTNNQPHHSGLFTTTVPSGSPNVWTSDDGSLHTNTGPITETGSWYTTTDANGSPSETYTIYPTSTHHSGLFTTTVPSGSPNVWTSDDGSLHTNTGPITETGSWYTTTDANGSPSETYTIYPTSNNGSPANTGASGAPGNSGMPGMNTNNQPHHSGLFTTTVPSGSPNVWTSDDGSLHTNTGPITETGSWYTTTDANGSPSETYTIYPTSNNGSPANTGAPGAPGNSGMPGMNTNNQPHHSGLFTTTVPSGSPNVWTSDDGSLHTNTGPITETGSWYTTTDANGSPSETYTIYPTSTHHSGLFTTTVPSGSPNVWTSDDGSLHTNTGPITETGSWYTTTDANGSPSETYTIYPTSNNGSPANTGAPGNSGMPGMNTNNQPHHSGLFTTTVPSGSPNVWTSDDGSLHTNTGPITETGSWYTTTDANGSPSETYTIYPTSNNGSPANTGAPGAPGNSGMPGMNTNNQPHHSGLFTTTVPSGSPNVWTSDDGSLHTNTGPITETGSWYTTTDANGSPSETYTIYPTRTHHSGLFTTTVPSGSPNVWTSDDGSLHTNTGPITETGSWYTTTDANGSPSETYTIYPTSNNGSPANTGAPGAPGNSGMPGMNTNNQPHHSGLFTTTVPSGSPNVWTSDDGSLHTNTGPITETGSWYTTTDANGSPSETYTIYPTVSGAGNGMPSGNGSGSNNGTPSNNGSGPSSSCSCPCPATESGAPAMPVGTETGQLGTPIATLTYLSTLPPVTGGTNAPNSGVAPSIGAGSGSGSGNAPSAVPGSGSGNAPSAVPGSGSGNAPSAVPGSGSGNAPSAVPGSGSGVAPSVAPGSGSGSGNSPSAVPGSGSGGAPSVAPGSDSGSGNANGSGSGSGAAPSIAPGSGSGSGNMGTPIATLTSLSTASPAATSGAGNGSDSGNSPIVGPTGPEEGGNGSGSGSNSPMAPNGHPNGPSNSPNGGVTTSPQVMPMPMGSGVGNGSPNGSGPSPTNTYGPEGPFPEPGENPNTPTAPSVATLSGDSSSSATGSAPIPMANSATTKGIKLSAILISLAALLI